MLVMQQKKMMMMAMMTTTKKKSDPQDIALPSSGDVQRDKRLRQQ